jgi:hypothetical protein
MANKKISVEDIKAAGDYKKLLDRQLEIEKQLVVEEQKRRDLRGKRVSQTQKEVELLEKELDLAERNLKFIEGGTDGIKDQIASLEILAKKQEENSKAQLKTLEEVQRLSAINEILAKDGVEAYKKLNLELIASKEALVALKVAGVSINKEIMGMLGVTEQWRDSIFGTLLGAQEYGNSFTDVLKEIGKEFKSTENQMNMLGSTMEKSQEVLMAVAASTKEVAFAVDSARSSVLLATGGFNNYDAVLNDIRQSHIDLAVTAEDVANVFMKLDDTVRSYSLMSESSQKEIANFVVTLEKMGVSSESSAQALQVSMGVLGQTKEQAIITQRELLGVAKALKEAPEKMVAGFAASASALAKYGDQMVGVFSRLSGAAKALQTDVAVLTGAFGSQMDTFEGAAMSSAKINQLLGGQFIDTMNLLQADEEQRIRMVLKGIQDSGQRADLMANKFGRLAFASAAGITDVAEANKILEMGLGGYDAMISKTKAGAMAQEEIAAKAKKALDVQKLLAAAMQSLAISMEPVISGVKSVIDGFITANKATSGALIPTLAVLVGIMSAAVLALKTMALARAAGIPMMATELSISEGMAISKKAEATARNQNASAMQREATAAKNQAASGVSSVAGTAGMMAKAKAAMAYGAALALVGVGFLAVASGVSMLAEATKGLAFDEFMMTAGLAAGIGVGLFLFAKGILAIGVAGTLGAPGILAIGGAVALMGVGLAVPIAAMALLVDKLKEAGPATIDAGLGFLALSTGVTILAGGMALMATFGVPGAGALIIFAAGLTAVALSLKLMGSELESLGKLFEGLGKFAEAGKVNFTGMVAGVKDLANAAASVSVENLTGFSALATVTHKIAEGAKVFDQPQVKTGVTRIKETVINNAGTTGATGNNTMTLSKESAKTLASEIVNSMKKTSADWQFFLKLSEGSESDYIRMHNRATQKARGKA